MTTENETPKIKVRATVAVLGFTKGETSEVEDSNFVRTMLYNGYLAKVDDTEAAEAETKPAADTPPPSAAAPQTADAASPTDTSPAPARAARKSNTTKEP